MSTVTSSTAPTQVATPLSALRLRIIIAHQERVAKIAEDRISSSDTESDSEIQIHADVKKLELPFKGIVQGIMLKADGVIALTGQEPSAVASHRMNDVTRALRSADMHLRSGKKVKSD